jgi:hypothetical protein
MFIREIIERLVKEELDKLAPGAGDMGTDTKRILDNIGYTTFLNSLSKEQKSALHSQLSHHLMSSLTVPMGWAEMGNSEKVLQALQTSQQRLSDLLQVLTVDDD